MANTILDRFYSKAPNGISEVLAFKLFSKMDNRSLFNGVDSDIQNEILEEMVETIEFILNEFE